MPDCVSEPGRVEQSTRPFFVLSTRQVSVLSLAAKGWTDFQIARQLGIATRTVRHHLEKARCNLQALNTTHAVAIAVAQNLIEVELVSPPGRC